MKAITSTEESALKSLSGSSSEIFPHLPFLLQDLWELGSSFEAIKDIIEKNRLNREFDKIRILDLGCGKGGVSIPLAKHFDAEVTGVDALPEFIEAAKIKSIEWNVENKCNFIAGDIRNKIDFQKKYNIVLLASVGPVLGNLKDTIDFLEAYLTDEGYLVLDVEYAPDGEKKEHPECPGKDEFYNMIDKSNFIVVDEYLHPSTYIEKYDIEMYNTIKRRADELIGLLPDKREIIEQYMRDQENENEMLESVLITLLILLKKKE